MFDDLIASGKAKFGVNCKPLDQFNATITTGDNPSHRLGWRAQMVVDAQTHG